MANELAINLANMWDVSTQDLPRVAVEFAGVSRNAQAAAGSAATELGRLAAPWEAPRAELQNYTAKTATNFYDAGDTLATATKAFAEADGVHAQWVRNTVDIAATDPEQRLKDTNGDGLYNSDDDGITEPRTAQDVEPGRDPLMEGHLGHGPRTAGL